MVKERFVIAIDGPNAVGKSAAAQALAKLLGYRYVNTGALYRAVAYVALTEGLSVRDIPGLSRIIEEIRIDLGAQGSVILVNGLDRTRELYTARTLSFTSEIAQLPWLREALLPLQRRQAVGGGVVAEGRDTGTVVFPDADWKFYLDAADWRKAERVADLLDEDERRRYSDTESILRYLREIDRRDMTRPIAPLRRASDAIFHDTTYSVNAEHDAHVLYNYMFNTRSVLENLEILKRRADARLSTTGGISP